MPARPLRVAFYAPMKSPNDSVPSGDRTVARLLMEALALAGCDVRLARELKTWSRTPHPDALAASETASGVAAEELIAAYGSGGWRPDLWFTYHVYYKAPDWLGPVVARRLGVPYVIAEATYSSKRDTGDWRPWQTAARAAIEAADRVYCFTQRDRRGLEVMGLAPERLSDFPPFLDLGKLPGRGTTAAAIDRSGVFRMITVAMMRPGDKLASYRALADSLARLEPDGWQLDIVGDGRAEAEVRTAFSAFSNRQVRYLGRLAPEAVHRAVANADLFVWPGFGEAFGMAYLEAQAMGVPVVACDTAGVSAVVADGVSGRLVEPLDVRHFANAVRGFMEDRALAGRMGRSALAHVSAHHSLTAAAKNLAADLGALVAAAR